ncbi:MAG: bifunctional enoyl-CoA hydratase/phosphate acetyltransferase [Candidatus Parabeggiatoa sp.]|nr:bifunctional enoyl-CoA hydratase/phosphate acetyltransferase [Candidatus Parabeggiatoa sp.]
MEFLENKTYDEIKIGDSATLSRTLNTEDIHLFAILSGDVNPTHTDLEYAQHSDFQKIMGHSLWSGVLLSNLLGNQLPGPGTVYRGQSFEFKRPVALGDTVTVTIIVKEKIEEGHRVIFDCYCLNQNQEVVYSGVADMYAPLLKIKCPRAMLPKFYLNHPGTQLQRLINMTKEFEPISMAVVHPVDANSLKGAIDAAHSHLIVPVFVGPESKIKAVAELEQLDLSPYRIIDTEHSHDAAAKSVAMARSGEVEAVMKGSLHTDELMSAAIRGQIGILTNRRMSHVFLMDVPTYPRPLFVTDAAINIEPTLETKRDIVQNAIDLAHALKVEKPKVAILSAIETVNPKMRSTLEAAALCKMADRKQITGGIIDGPLAFDNAVSEEAAHIKGIESPVAGQADILVAPDLESGNMLAKQLEYMAEAQSAGIVLGARVPIALTSRADTVLSRMASCALALLLAHYQRDNPLSKKL